MASAVPPIEELLLQRQDMLLLDEIIDHGADYVKAGVRLRKDHPLADGADHMPAFVGLELMAQAVSAFSALELRQRNQPPRIGLLLGAREYQSWVPHFPFETPLQVRATLALRDDTGLAVFNCTIRGAGQVLAQAQVKGYMPQDIDEFLDGGGRE